MTTLELGHEQQAIQTDRRLVAGRYRLHAQIGRGRLGDIYEADDEGYRELGVGGRVAVQLLPDRIALDQGLFSKLKLGYTVLRAGSHPNLVSYLDCDHDGKFGYVVMELLDGASLRFVLDDVSTLPLDEALPVIRAIGDALQFLHAKAMVHGQVSAENVFVTDDLEIRLLDIVPLDSASAVLRGVASRDPFSRLDIGDDIHALACLTYEILAGRHPFNFHPPAEARRAGLRPARIPSLPEQQWNALQRALSFDTGDRPATVSDFFDDFGVNGTERLRPSNPASTGQATAPVRPAEPATPARQSPPAPRAAATAAAAAPQVITAAGPRVRKRRPGAAAERGRANRVRPFVLLLLLAGVCAWYFLGQPGNDIARLTAFAESYPEPVPDEGAVAIAPAGPASQAPVEETASVPVTASPADPDDAAAAAREPALAPAGEAVMPAAGEPAPSPVGAAPVEVAAAAPAADTATRDEAPAVPDTRPDSSDTRTASLDEPPGSTLVQALVTVNEQDGAARIAFRRPVGSPGSVFWWTEDGTAVADADYIALEQPVTAFAAGEEAETLHVPLINDSLPEPGKTFYVFLGQRDVGSGRFEPIARVRVDIDDDD